MLPDTIRNIIAVGAGSFIGGIARYIVSPAMKGISKGFPWATVLVNLSGCLIIGLLWGFLSRNASESTSWGFASYIALSILAGIALVALGYYIAR